MAIDLEHFHENKAHYLSNDNDSLEYLLQVSYDEPRDVELTELSIYHPIKKLVMPRSSSWPMRNAASEAALLELIHELYLEFYTERGHSNIVRGFIEDRIADRLENTSIGFAGRLLGEVLEKEVLSFTTTQHLVLRAGEIEESEHWRFLDGSQIEYGLGLRLVAKYLDALVYEEFCRHKLILLSKTDASFWMELFEIEDEPREDVWEKVKGVLV